MGNVDVLWREHFGGLGEIVETLRVVVQPEVEFQILGRILDVEHVVHEITESAWLGWY